MSEISAGGMTFKKGKEIVSYEVEKGAPREFLVIDKSKDNPPGLILKNLTNGRQFAITAASVATKVKKLAQPQDVVAPKEEKNLLSEVQHQKYSNPQQGEGPKSYPAQAYPSQQYSFNPNEGQRGRLGRVWDKLKPKGGKGYPGGGGEPSRGALEFLIAVAIAVHVADALWLNFSISAVNIGIRIFMYFILSILAHAIINKGWSASQSFLELFKVSAIPLFAVPLLSVILGWLTLPDKAIEIISAVTLAFPIWIFYIMYMRGGQEASAVEGGFFKKLFNLIVFPSGWVKIWFFVLILAVMYNIVTLMGVAASDIPGAEASGFDVKDSIQGLTEFFTSTIQTFSTSAKGFITAITVGVEKYKNETLGYYTGTVEENQGESTGIFITSFKVNGKVYESMPLMAFGYIRAKSFVDGVSIDVSCYAQDLGNKSNIYEGKVSQNRLENIKIEDQRGVSCILEDVVAGYTGLPAGRYQVYFVLKFNFETWAYKEYYFMDSDYLIYLRTSGENPNSKLEIPLKTKTIYTNGPLMIGMDDTIDMPFALSKEDTNYLPIGMTLDNKPPLYGAKGEVLKVNKYTLRLPQAIEIDREACTISSNLIEEQADELPGYRIYTFRIPEDSLAGTYMTMNCNLKLEGESVKSVIPGANTPAMITVVGTAAYDYKLSKMITVTVEKTPGSR